MDDELAEGKSMTEHDRLRRDRALRVKGAAYASVAEEMNALLEAIGGLQSTDDPSLVPLHEELWARYRRLEKESADGK